MTTDFATWNARPVFLSSTFADMHDERDTLRVHAFEPLADQLRQRRHYLETIDLRQGVETAGTADEGGREMKVLKVCLDEIKRSRPFFVGLIGDRYGWTPPPDRMIAAARAAGFETEVAGRSVTDLEILYGVLENPDQIKRSWFYLRELDYGAMSAEMRKRFDDRCADDPEAPGRVKKLEALKARLWSDPALAGRVRAFQVRWEPDPENPERGVFVDGGVERPRADGGGTETVPLAVAVRDDLWSDIEPETRAWLAEAPQTWQEAEARLLDDFVANRLRVVGDEIRGFTERDSVTGPLLAHAFSPAAEGAVWGRCLTGEAGSGKSSVFARVYWDLRRRQARAPGEDFLVLAHAAGISPRSGSVDSLLRRWIRELAAFLGVEDPSDPSDPTDPTDPSDSADPARRAPAPSPEEVEETFASLLGQAAARTRVVVLVDALNQFERSTRARYLTWLPKLWPANARFLATAIPGEESQTLAAMPGVEVSALAPMTPTEAREVAAGYYRERFHREPNRLALDTLLARRLDRDDAASPPACGNPLWLELALQEMNLLEADDYALAEREFSGLPGGERIQALQAREAGRLPPDPAGVYGELLARAERDFGQAHTRAVIGLIALGRAGWRESDLEALVPQVCGDAWDELAFAGLRRALGQHLVQRGAHGQWDCFHAQLREAVLARQLADGGERRRLHGLLAGRLEGLPGDDPLRISETMVHLIGFGDRTRAARWLAQFWYGDVALAAAAAVLAQHVAAVADGLDFMAGLCSAEGLSEHEIGRVASLLHFDGLEALERETGLGPRLILLDACRAALERLARSDPSNAGWQRDLSVSFNKIGDVQLNQGNLGEALEAYRQSLAVRERLARSDPSNAGWQRDLWVSYWRLGDIADKSGGGGAGEWWGKCYRQIAAMKERGILAPPDAQYLETARKRAGL